ncbi:hypothetical protein [Nocardioides euryhalodurans]|uniref:Uncharacterized protein n=1 Tax=Nocardioides euryhalodurans TaxID=2518370 RepID=A0A4P7GMB0_9ACTN|nr:hypothetical protein [Nocardioides euryhalodurans]QBR93150.1 hypothetical protein EXE57_13370 [Nocardioides euryhalodurans]
MQTWTLTVDGREHRVTAAGTLRHAVEWQVDGEVVALKKAAEERIRLEADDHGSMDVRFSTTGSPRRATWHAPDADAAGLAGIGGLDLEPEPGSPAAAYEERVRAHPRRYATIQTAGGVGKVVVPILLTLLVITLPWPSIPWPDLPSIPLPDLPEVPWPDLPAIPWPDLDLPDWQLPGWVRWVLDNATYVVPIVLAFVLARVELRRRRHQDELREQRRRELDDRDQDQA